MQSRCCEKRSHAFYVKACNVYRNSIESTQLIKSIILHLCTLSMCVCVPVRWAQAEPLLSHATIKIDISVDRHADRKNDDIDHQWRCLIFVTLFQRFIKGLFQLILSLSLSLIFLLRVYAARSLYLSFCFPVLFYSIKSTMAAIASRNVDR